MRIVALKTDLFPDARTVAAALATLAGEVTVLDLTRLEHEEADWLRIVDALLAAERIITL
ncbi:hypothetical protein [Thiobacter aerophilum]|uniref:Uncharacterized protein n=1 Tax=Thiobacter aerophilum TaxID=3121275 RepID=A0ABV0EB85_9BURK